VVAAFATLLGEKRDMDDGKPCCPLELKAASMTLPICHYPVHRPLLAVTAGYVFRVRVNAATSVELPQCITISLAMFRWAFRKSRRVVSSTAHSRVHWRFSISTGVGMPSSKPVSSIKSSSIAHALGTVCACSFRLGDGVQCVCDGRDAFAYFFFPNTVPNH
jgi:hypothetical protein